MSEDRIKALETGFDSLPVEVSEHHGVGSPAGDVATQYLQKAEAAIQEYLKLKLKDGLTKTVLLAQLSYIFAIINTAVEHALK